MANSRNGFKNACRVHRLLCFDAPTALSLRVAYGNPRYYWLLPVAVCHALRRNTCVHYPPDVWDRPRYPGGCVMNALRHRSRRAQSTDCPISGLGGAIHRLHRIIPPSQVAQIFQTAPGQCSSSFYSPRASGPCLALLVAEHAHFVNSIDFYLYTQLERKPRCQQTHTRAINCCHTAFAGLALVLAPGERFVLRECWII